MAFVADQPTRDVHWKRQTSRLTEGKTPKRHHNTFFPRCPLCLGNFSIYARLEDSYEDTAYFILHNNLVGRVDAQRHKNQR